MDKRLEIIVKKGGVKSRADAEAVVRIVEQEFLNRNMSFSIQLATPYHCKLCGECSLEWKEMHRIPLTDTKKETIKEGKEKARKARLNVIDMLVESTITREREVKG